MVAACCQAWESSDRCRLGRVNPVHPDRRREAVGVEGFAKFLLDTGEGEHDAGRPNDTEAPGDS